MNNTINVKVTKSKYKYNKFKNSETINAWLLLREYLVVVINTTITLEQTIVDSSVKLLEIQIVTDCVYARVWKVVWI